MSRLLFPIIFASVGFFAQFVLASGSLPESMQLTFACFENCQRNSISKVGGQWKSEMIPVNTFTVSLTKGKDAFEMSASGGTSLEYTMTTALGSIPTSIEFTKLYNYKTNSAGDLIENYYNPPTSVGFVRANGEVEINELFKCSIKSEPTRGNKVFFAKCDDDFSGYVELTKSKVSPF